MMITEAFIVSLLVISGDTISGGWRGSPIAFYYMVGIIEDGGDVICGGAILDPTHILTAAHCVVERKAYHVYAGSVTLRAQNYEIRRVADIRFHPQYTQTQRPSTLCPGQHDTILDNDIAVLILESALPETDRIGSVALDERGMNTSCRKCCVAGWGLSGTETDNFMHWMRVKVLSGAESAAFAAPITPTTIGAINVDMEATALGADSGSPLVCGALRRTRRVVGVLSSSTCNPRLPAIYGSVSKHIEFITSALRN